MPGLMSYRLSLCAMATGVVLASSLFADVNAQSVDDVNGSRGEQFTLSGMAAGGSLHWCGNDTVVFVRARTQDGMFNYGDLVQQNIVTGEVTVLHEDIYKALHLMFSDWPPYTGQGDHNGMDVMTWPITCSPDGRWLFFQHEEYDQPISKVDRSPELRVRDLTTGQETVLASRFEFNRQRQDWLHLSPDNRRLIIGGILNTAPEWTDAQVPWERVEIPTRYQVEGWFGDSSVHLVVTGPNYPNPWGLYNVTEGSDPFQAFILPQDLQELLKDFSKAPLFNIVEAERNWILGELKLNSGLSSGGSTTYYRCDVEGLALRCQALPSLGGLRRYYTAWTSDGSSVLYSRNGSIVRRDVSVGETVLTDDGCRAAPYDISPRGNRLIITCGYYDLRVLFLEPPAH